MLLSALPLGMVDTAYAAALASGKCGDSASWKLDTDGVLTITGTGPMADYGQHASDNCAPWRIYANDIKKVVVQKGVTAIGSYAFASLERVTSVTIPEGVTSIGSSAFENCGLMAYGGLGAVTLPEGYAGRQGEFVRVRLTGLNEGGMDGTPCE